MSNDEFLTRLYETQSESQSMDDIFNFTNKLLKEEKFEQCDQLLTQVDLSKIPIKLMVTFLMATTSSAPLPNRERFVASVKQVVVDKRGKKNADALVDRFSKSR